MKKIFFYLLFFPTFFFAQEKPTYKPEAEKINQLIHTKLKVNFDFEKEHLFGEEWLTASPYFYPTDSLRLDAKAMDIHKVELVKKRGNQNLNFDYQNKTSLLIHLDKTYKKDENYTIYIKYTAKPNEVKQKGGIAVTDAKGLYFINPRGIEADKPTQIWTQGEPESNSAWFPTIDKPNQKTTQELYITVPNNFVTLSNGTLISEKDNKNGTRTDYWKQTQKHAPYLFFMGIGDFAVIKDQWKNKKVDYYVEHEYADFAKEIFGMTPEMISFFSEKFGYEYPWDKYAQMVVRDYVSGAMENSTAVVHGEKAQQKHGQLIDENVWEDVIAHELAHHWFGNLVTTESWANITVNESFANYSEYLWREYKYGKDHADAHLTTDISNYFFGDNFNKDLVRFHYHAHDDVFDLVSYNKGGYILHMLRNFLGDDAFFAGLKNYLIKHQYGKAEAHQLRLAMEETSGKDLNWFFNQWYFGNGHPEFTVVTENRNKEIEVNIKQTQGNPLFSLPITIDVYENGKRKRYKVWLDKKEVNTFKFAVKNQADLVIVNSDYMLLSKIQHDKSVEQLANQYKWAKDEYNSRKNALEEIAIAQLTNDKALKTLLDGLKDPYFGLRIQAINALVIEHEKVANLATPILSELAKNDEKTTVRAAAMEKLAKLNKSEFLPIFENGLNSESFSVQSQAINYLLEKNPEKAEAYSKKLDDEVIKNAPNLLASMIPIWKEKNDVSKLKNLSELAAFYAFTPFQNPKLAEPSKMAFEWIMSTDTPKITEQIAKMQKAAYEQVKENNPMAMPFIENMTKKGLELKKKAYTENPTESLKKQIELLEKTIKEYR